VSGQVDKWRGPARRKWIVAGSLLLLLFLVLAVQLAHIPSCSVKFDQAQVLLLATGALADGRVPQHGILNSLRAYNPPFFVWLYIPAMAITREPPVVLILPGLCLHLASMLALFHLGRRYVGPKGGLRPLRSTPCPLKGSISATPAGPRG